MILINDYLELGKENYCSRSGKRGKCAKSGVRTGCPAAFAGACRSIPGTVKALGELADKILLLRITYYSEYFCFDTTSVDGNVSSGYIQILVPNGLYIPVESFKIP